MNNASPKTFSPLPGLGVALVIVIISTIFSFGHAALDPLVLSILIGIILGPYIAFCFSIAIAGIGLSVETESIIDAGPKRLLAAFIGRMPFIILFILGVGLIP
ncbi:MAG: hypothetical protein A2Z46_08145 [Nitrospirae bacterium RBG_19FT_COMBO_55_12]|nr:MAG: hypothetical protein A2Z46_08145 [Nitrospirae bacterium RBG_19FT_COMBO_55_12]